MVKEKAVDLTALIAQAPTCALVTPRTPASRVIIALRVLVQRVVAMRALVALRVVKSFVSSGKF